MAIEILLVLLITAGAEHLFVSEKFRADLVALMVLGALVVVGLFGHLAGWIRLEKWITPEEGISGFRNPATITVAAMFVFAPLGVVMLGAGTVYLLLFSRWLLPNRRGAQLTENYQLGEYITELRVRPESKLVGQTVVASEFGRKADVTVLEILLAGQRLFAPLHEPVREGDVLLVRGGARELMDAKAGWKLELEPEFQLKDEALAAQDLQLAEVLVSPRSNLIGQRLAGVDFRRRYNAIVLAIQARQQTVREKLNRVQQTSISIPTVCQRSRELKS